MATRTTAKDPYKVLGVGRNASRDEIKRAYRNLAKKLHPDVNPGNKTIEQQFKEVSQAHGILGNAKKRKLFDEGRIDAGGQETGWSGGAHRGFTGGGRYREAEFGPDVNIEDIISDFFGGRGRAPGGRGRKARPPRGADVHYKAPIGFLDAAIGAKKRIRLSDGKILNVKIPAGTEEGQILRLKGQGTAAKGAGPAGDAYVEVRIEPHPFFTREKSDVHLELPVTLQEAVLGATVTVPTVHGKVSMKIPAGSNSGTSLRLKGKGVLDRKSRTKGNQYVKLVITLPAKPDQELKEFAERWTKAKGYDPRRKAGLS